jgi:hypothetical protein
MFYIKYPFNVLLFCGGYYVIILYKKQNSLFYKNGATGGGGVLTLGCNGKTILVPREERSWTTVGPQLDHSALQHDVLF